MSNVTHYGYEYFCGANVVVELNGIGVTEVVGLSYDLMENRIPIYQYSSRFFNGMANGQVLVEGELLINYVHQDYLMHALEVSRNQQAEDLITQRESLTMLNTAAAGSPGIQEAASALRNNYWTTPSSPKGIRRTIGNPNDLNLATSIKITFGERNKDQPDGFSSLILDSVYFRGRGTPIQITENVIIERYSFIARNIIANKIDPIEYDPTAPEII